MILFATKAIDGYNIRIPDNICNGDNIYSFHKMVEKIVGNKPLPYDEHKRLYNGESIKINDVQTLNGFVKNGVLRYDLDSNKLNIEPVGPITGEKQEATNKINQKPPQKRKSRKI